MAVSFKRDGARCATLRPMIDLEAAGQFIHNNGRLLERRRFEHLFGAARDDAGVLRAVEAYKNPDGGVGCLEPDLRTPASQPSAVLYAFEVLEELDGLDDAVRAFATTALDWVATIADDDGGIPFVLPTAAGHAHAPWWAPTADPPSSLLMTAGVTAVALRLGLRDHPWVAKSTDHLWDAMASLTLSDPYAFRYTVHVLDAMPDRARAEAEIAALAERMPADGVLKVEAGVEDETLSALEVAPRPGHLGRRLFPATLVERQLDELADGQEDDGGWDFTWAAWNPAAALEWRGMVTLNALTTLRANGRLAA
jgi:hypothetical protein